MFSYSYLHQGPWRTQTCRYDAISRCNPFEQLVNLMRKVFLFITEIPMHCILILIFFPAELSSPQYLLLSWWSRSNDTMREHSTFPGTIICAKFSFTFCRLQFCRSTQFHSGTAVTAQPIMIFKLLYSHGLNKYPQHSREFRFDLTNDLMMLRLA